MQTFMPYPNFTQTALSLDMKRLGKQRVEGMQILMVLTGLNKGKAWQNHPAVKMWRGYEVALADYIYAICDVWTGKGYKDTCKEKVKNIMQTYYADRSFVLPPWLGNDEFHNSHKSNLLRKKPEHYSRFFLDIPDDLPYTWPMD